MATDDERETLPWFAERLREWFPELEGRALPVSWGDVAAITRDTTPSLPVAFVAPGRQRITHNGGRRASVVENFTVEFWLKPERVKREDGTETPFWAYYAVNAYRDRLFSRIGGIRTPIGGALTLESMEVEADELAVVVSFGLQASYEICADLPPEAPDGLPVPIRFKLCAPPGVCPPQPEPEEDPCP